MKLFISALTLLVFCSWLRAQETTNTGPARIKSSEAKQHLNAQAVVLGKVVEVSKSEKVVSLNFDKPFPGNPFTAVIFSSKTNLFPDLDKLKGKEIEVTGKIADYRGKPEIILSSTNQLKVVEKAAVAEGK